MTDTPQPTATQPAPNTGQAQPNPTPGQQPQPTTTATDSLLDFNNPAGDGYKPLDIKEGVKPEGLDDSLWDPEKKTIKIDELHKRYQDAEKRAKGLRDKLAKGVVPKDAKEYEFKVPEKYAKDVPADDPVVNEARQVALKYGMSKEMFAGFMAEMTEKVGALRAAGVPQQEQTPEQIAAAREIEMQSIGGNPRQIIGAVTSFIKEMKDSGDLNEKQVEFAKELAAMPGMAGRFISFMNAVRARYSRGGDVPIDTIDDGLPPDHIIADMMDKAYQSKDHAKIKEIEDLLDRRRKAGRPEKLKF